MKRVILALALATMVISCKKETKVEKTEEVTEEQVPVEAVPDTMTTKTETTVDTARTDGTVKKTETTTKVK